MVDDGNANPDTGMLMEKQGSGRPRGNKNKPKDIFLVASSSASAKRRFGRPLGSKNKPRTYSAAAPGASAAAPGASATSRNASPPPSSKIYSFSVLLVHNAVNSSVFR
jgi:hypothetical protein